jgi:AmiR/NasT family two-component response regulator
MQRGSIREAARREPGQRWRIAVLDAHPSTRTRLVSDGAPVGVDVGVASRLRPDVVPLIRHTRCDAVVLVMDVPDPEAVPLLTELECPVVLCSEDTSPHVVHIAQRLGAMAFLVKPIRAEQLAPTISLAIARFRERQRLQRALAERKVIERAKGRLMMLQGMSEDDAFRWLRRRAMDTRSRLADVARDVLSRPDTPPGRLPAAAIRPAGVIDLHADRARR